MKPERITKPVCSVCDLYWRDHEVEAKRRTYADVGLDEDVVEHYEVELIDCITLLKKQHQGPMGPTGPMGAMGMQGPEGPRGESAPFMHSNPYR